MAEGEVESWSKLPVILGTPGSSCAPGSLRFSIGSDGGWRAMMYAVWSVEKESKSMGKRCVKGGETVNMQRKQDQESRTRQERAADR